MTKRKTKTKYRVLIGLDFEGKRAEPGKVRTDIPEESVEWLLKQGAIEPVEE